ncbi:hypothetical protein SCLCIDRAFT_1214007 [Scleroderma citrinum Foug A]|uniref:SET domain-containing protein n=1 Tax=Scleroderma citrinum Foug A TaxID=1036808 RepID=A0A0C3E5C0_9AGAM|nr:hypothetical protein SCLCIDRAFT_1214007 [Scleroderma citrinum Foug A]
MAKTSTMLTVAGIAVGGLVAYAVYFDYRRRTDANFRKHLRKDKKRVAKSQTSSETSVNSGGVEESDLKSALEQVRKEEVPASAEEKERYFMSQVAMGEQLCARGPSFNLNAAMCFYRALRVYPSPVELIVIYEKTVPAPVFQLVMQLTNMDVKERVEGYYDCFPAKAMNVAVKTVDVPVNDKPGAFTRKKVLVCTKDFELGDLIYKEDAIVTALDMDLQGKGTHCSHCLRIIDTSSAVRPEIDWLHSVYCSQDCHNKAETYSQRLLFSLGSPIPEQIAVPLPASTTDERKKVQDAFTEYLEKRGKAAPQLVARFIARQVSAETAKMLATGLGTAGPADLGLTDGGDYTLYDHLERLRYLEMTPPEEETKLLKGVLQSALPGLEQFVTEERHATYLGGMSYNAFGVYFGEGREDKPEPTERPEDVEKTRTPIGTQKQVGAGFYAVSSYLNHSCTPSARPSFDNGTAELHVIASRALKCGDELTIAYVDVSQKEGESVVDARRRRRIELARGWRFACTCERCAKEADGMDEDPARDESKVSDAVNRVEGV